MLSAAAMSSTKFAAEIGAVFLCADLGITPETRDDRAAYIAFERAAHHSGVMRSVVMRSVVMRSNEIRGAS
jgi:antirestriction protein ArdC